MQFRASIVAQARWEHHDICEWLEYHRWIGFDHVWLYSNDDEPHELRKRLAPYTYGNAPFVTFIHWPKAGQQFLIYFDFLTKYAGVTEWVTFLDIDEFFTLKKTGTVSSLISSFEADFDSINLNWIIYGNNGRLRRDPSLDVLPSYTRRSRTPNLHTKNITRVAAIDVTKVRAAFDDNALGFWHFWDRYPFPDMRICNILGQDVRGYTNDFPGHAQKLVSDPDFADAVIDTGYIAHFQIKSEEDYIRRVARGGSENTKFFLQVFESGRFRAELANNNAVEDTFLAKLWLDYTRPLRSIARYNYVPTPNRENVALWCPTSQSSVTGRQMQAITDGWCRDHANDGFRSGKRGFETNWERDPWWQVDLLSRRTIDAVHVYNCFKDQTPEQRGPLWVEVRTETGEWTMLYVLEVGQRFGGVDGSPLVIAPSSPVRARYLRITAPGEISLALDEVEVYGR